jgi:hypothetical protein
MVTPFARGGRRYLRAHRWHAAVVCKDVVANSTGSARRFELGDCEQRAAQRWMVPTGQPLMDERHRPAGRSTDAVSIVWMACMCTFLDWCTIISIAKIN